MTSSWFAHSTAIVEDGALIGEGAKIWHFAHIRGTAVIGAEVSIGKDVYVDDGVAIGKGARIQNGVSVYHGVHVSDWCFVGPYVVFTNDLTPRVGNKSWKVIPTTLETGCSLGAGVIVKCGVRIGAFAMIGAGAIVTHDIPPFRLALGVPARPGRKICACGQSFFEMDDDHDFIGACCRENMDPRVRADAERIAAQVVAV